MYQWLLFLHVGSVLAFMLAHGVQVIVTWRMRWQEDPRLIAALFEPLPSMRPLRLSMVAIFVTGVLLMAELGAWTRWWIWLSIAVLALIWVLMWQWGGAYYGSISQAAEAAVAAKGNPGEPAALAEFHVVRKSWRVPALTVVGLGGLAAILWLMIFRPF